MQEGCHLLLQVVVCSYITVSVIRYTQQGMALRLSVHPPQHTPAEEPSKEKWFDVAVSEYI